MKTAVIILLLAISAVALAKKAGKKVACTVVKNADKSACSGSVVDTDLGNGETACCFSGTGISVAVRTANGVSTVQCTCTGVGGGGAHTVKKVGAGRPSHGSSKKEVPLEDFRQAALERHNQLRARHGSPPLKLSSDLNAYAQRWAEQMALEDNMYHSNRTMRSGEVLGENIASAWGSAGADYEGPEPVQAWYDEISLYDYSRTNGQSGTGHFTQVVWKNSKELGMGKAKTEDGKGVYTCASYRGPGNVNYIEHPEKWRANVPRLLN